MNPGREEDPTDAQNEPEERSNLRWLLARAGANRMTAEEGYALEAKAGGNAPDKLTWGRTSRKRGQQVAVDMPIDAGDIRVGGMRRKSEL